MNTILLRYVISLPIIFLELLSLLHFQNSRNVNVVIFGDSFNDNLRLLGGLQFLIVANIEVILQTAIFACIIFLSIIFLKSSQLNYIKIIKLQKLKAIDLSYNAILFLSIIGIYLLVRDSRALILHPYSSISIFFSLTPIIWLLYFLTLVNLLFPFQNFIKIINENKLLSLIIFILVSLTQNEFLRNFLVQFWSAMLLEPTVNFAISLLNFFSINAHNFSVNQYGDPIIGTKRFQVEILASCSGYEGVLLIVFLLFIYCYMVRDRYYFTRSILVIPLASILIFILNAIRIAMLISIGHFWSPQIALNGFHLVAGWLNLIVILVISILIINNLSVFKKDTRDLKGQKYFEGDIVLLYPIMGLIGLSLFSKIFVVEFQWLYPLPILACLYILLHLKKYFKVDQYSFSALPIIIGIVVFIFWVYIVPADSVQNSLFIEQLQMVPIGVEIIWILFRIFGATIIVPIAEEFAFRGFMFPYLEALLKNYCTQVYYLKRFSSENFFLTAITLIITSVLFGLLHSEVLAGTLAGLCYGLTYLQRRSIMDSILAHSITNFLLAIDVVFLGNWSYW